MKSATTLLFAALLLALASATFAADAPAANPASAPLAALDPAPVATAFSATAAPAGECGRASASTPFVQLAWEKPVAGLAPNSCGACSTPNCNGALRGQMCWLGGVSGGWGHCNIYSGGYRCETGGWECQCGVGPLP